MQHKHFALKILKTCFTSFGYLENCWRKALCQRLFPVELLSLVFFYAQMVRPQQVCSQKLGTAVCCKEP